MVQQHRSTDLAIRGILNLIHKNITQNSQPSKNSSRARFIERNAFLSINRALLLCQSSFKRAANVAPYMVWATLAVALLRLPCRSLFNAREHYLKLRSSARLTDYRYLAMVRLYYHTGHGQPQTGSYF